MANRPPLAWCYGRHSTRKQGMTEKTQRSKCMNYYANNLEPKGVLLAHSQDTKDPWFYDTATSGGTIFSERWYGSQIYHNCKAGDYLIVSSLDRLFRNKVDGFRTLDQLERKGVKRVCIDLPDMSEVSDPVMVDMIESNMVFYAHIFKRMQSQKMINDNARKRADNVPFSHVAPIGFKIVGEGRDREYRVDERERKFCDAIAKLHDSGMTFRNIAVWCWSKGTKEMFKPKKGRSFESARYARWAYRARQCGYPYITNEEDFTKWYTEEHQLV